MNSDSVKKWLEKHHRDRNWLAAKVGTKKRTVDNWLSSPRGIPSRAELIIERLMHADALLEKKDPPQNLVLEFDSEEWELINEAALRAGMRTRKWAEDTLRKVASENIRELTQELFAAESQRPFRRSEYSSENTTSKTKQSLL